MKYNYSVPRNKSKSLSAFFKCLPVKIYRHCRVMITKVVTVSGLNAGMFIHIKPLKVPVQVATVDVPLVLMSPEPYGFLYLCLLDRV